MNKTIAALYVDARGVYSQMPGVECWDVERDARLYAGPHPVVAHPPCERWGRYWYGGPMRHAQGRRMHRGDDGGCFAAALWAVRTFGGVLEHPEASSAWRWHGITTPPRGGGWVEADTWGGMTCCVEQGHYGHRARKATWLYAVVAVLPSLTWGKSKARVRLDDGYHSSEERAEARRRQRLGELRAVGKERISRAECYLTPPAFAEILVSMARSV